jgi:hypothetical protein
MKKFKNKCKYFVRVFLGKTFFLYNKIFNANAPIAIILSKGQYGHSKNVTMAAKELGFQIHIFCPDFPVNEARFGSKWHKVDCECDFEIAREIALRLKPSVILIESKHSLLVMQNELAKITECKTVGDLASITSNSKFQMRVALKAANVGTLKWHTLKSLLMSETELSANYVFKPEVGSGSAGVRLVRSTSQLNNLFGETEPINGIVEEFISGRQFDLEGVAVDGEFFPLCLIEEHYGDAAPYFPPSWFLFNPPIDDDTRTILVENAKRALRALGVKNGAWHIEQRIDKNTGDIIVLDYANRMGYNKLVSHATQRSFPALYIRSMTSETYSYRDHTVDSDLGCLLKIYAFDNEQKQDLLDFARQNPELVLQVRTHSQMIGDWTFAGFIVFKTDNVDQLFTKLSTAELLHEKIREYYFV